MPAQALLVLEDGRTFRGTSYGAQGTALGEAVFTTGMTGYQETLTDPSYARQLIVQTAPHIGNTGVNAADNESTQDLGCRLRCPRRRPPPLQLALARDRSTTSSSPRASLASRVLTPAPSPATCANAAP